MTNPAPTGERGNILLPLRSGRTTAARSMRIACASRETVLSNPCLFVPEDRIPYIDSQLPALSTEESMIFFSHCPGGCIPGHGFSRVSPMHCPRPPRGGRGLWGGTPGYPPAGRLERNLWVPACGEGECPLPGPLPPWRYPHGPLHGGSRRETSSGAVLPCLSFRETGVDTASWHGFPPGIATHCPRPREGAGEERAARAGWGGRRGALCEGGDEGPIGSVHLESMR